MGLVSNSNTGKVEYLIDLEGGKGGSAKQSTLLSITTTPSGTFEKGSQYYNSNTRLIYTAVEDNTWTDAKTSDPEFGTVYIYDDNGTTEYYQWDGDNLVETDLEKYQLVNNISQDFEEDSETKYPSSKALSDGLKSLKTFPTVVTDSGSSLPVDLTGYNAGDTFLNTTDKKIYKTVVNSYTFNTGVGGSATVDFITGIASNFSASSYNSFATVYKNGDFGLSAWAGNKTYKIHFKLNSIPTDDKQYGFVFGDTYTSSNYLHNQWGLYVKNKQIYIKTHYEQTSSSYDVTNLKILDYELSADVEYFLEIQKSSDGNCVAKLSANGYEGTNLETKNFTLADYYVSNPTSISFVYGRCPYIDRSNYDTTFSIGQIYLLDSSGEFLVPSSDLFWDNGTDLTDKTEVADKTNRALYLYENSELVKIGGNLTKKVYTISADNISTLDVSSDFTRIVDVLKNGVELAITDDYTISSGVITFVTALSTTDKITVKGE